MEILTKYKIHMGIAVRSTFHFTFAAIYRFLISIVAGILRLHREETYNLPQNASADAVVDSEVARRTFWTIQCVSCFVSVEKNVMLTYLGHDNLYTGHNAPVSITRSDITTLLPCEESDFAFGRITTERAALSGTLAAESNPELTSINSRSLFATLIQVHNLWGKIARRAFQADRESKPWLESSDYNRLAQKLRDFEEKMPDRHRWSLWNFRGYKTEAVELVISPNVSSAWLLKFSIRHIYLLSLSRG